GEFCPPGGLGGGAPCPTGGLGGGAPPPPCPTGGLGGGAPPTGASRFSTLGGFRGGAYCEDHEGGLGGGRKYCATCTSAPCDCVNNELTHTVPKMAITHGIRPRLSI